jgi:hypothetical protein
LVGAEEVQKAEAGLPPFCGDGIVGDELVVCWFGGLEDAVSFVGLGEGGAGFGVGFELVDYGVEVERYQFVDVARMLGDVSMGRAMETKNYTFLPKTRYSRYSLTAPGAFSFSSSTARVGSNFTLL